MLGQRLLEVQVRLRSYCHLGQWVELQQLQVNSSNVVNIVDIMVYCIENLGDNEEKQ